MSTLKPAKRVAVIGAGPSGAITVDALVKERVFDVIKVFERREGPGGCWIGDATPPPHLTNLPAIAARTADPPLSPPLPETLPARTPRSSQPRFAESSIYPYLETNVDDLAMSFTGGGLEDVPAERTAWSVGMHGADTPFRHWTVMRRYVAGLLARDGYEALVSYRTSVERAAKDDGGGGTGSGEWVLTLRREGENDDEDLWYEERFDAVVVASGHFNVPWIPHVDGLDEFERSRPGSVLHSKMYRGREDFRGKRVVVVGASVSAGDIAYDLATHRVTRDGGLVHAVVVGHTFNGYFGDEPFRHPLVRRHPSIARVDAAARAVHLVDGGVIRDVDHVLFGTGYSWSLPFLAADGVGLKPRNNRVPGLYQHVVWREDPTLLFVGAVGAGLTFKIFEWQAVYAARVLAGRGRVPTREAMRAWEEERVRAKGDGPGFQMVFPDFEAYFEELRALAGGSGGGEATAAAQGVGRRLPPFDEAWFRAFMEGHERRKAMWRRINEQDREKLKSEGKEEGGGAAQSHL